MRTKRQGLVVWFQHMKNVRHIKRYGHLIYSSKKSKYAIIYVDQDVLDSVESKLLQLSFVSKVERSYKPFLRTDFENPQLDEAKQYDYKIGI